MINNLDFLSQYFFDANFTKSHLDLVISYFERKEYKKGSLFVRENKVCDYLGLIESGFFVKTLNSNNRNKTFCSAGRNNILVCIVSFFDKTPSQVSIKCISKGVVWLIRERNLTKLKAEIMPFASFYTKILETELRNNEQTKYDSMILNSEGMYYRILQKDSLLMEELPLHHIADMIGITPKHLSRIRAKKN